MGRKATNAEAEYRRNRVARLLSNGATRSEVKQYCASEWGLRPRQCDTYIQQATEILKADWDIDRRTFTAEIMSQLASLQKEARKTNQSAVALGCINSMARIAQILA
jgi:hypothetical protein